MGQLGRVTLGILIVLFIQITYRQCMPRNINAIPLQTNKKLKRISMYKPTVDNPLMKTCKSCNNMKSKPTNDKPNQPQNKYSTNLLNKLLKEAKTKLGENTKTELGPSPLSKPFAQSPQPFCFKEFGTFPDVEYPMFVTDTWSPNYWKQLPNIPSKTQSVNDVPKISEANYIKPSDKSIQKAIKALEKLRDKSNKATQPIVNSKPTSTSTDMCPLDQLNQCSPADQPKPTNSTIITPTIQPALIPSGPLSSSPTQSQQTSESDSKSPTADSSTSEITTPMPLTESDTSQLPYPTSATPTYFEQVIPTATTAMPPYAMLSSDDKIPSTDVTTSTSDVFSTEIISLTDNSRDGDCNNPAECDLPIDSLPTRETALLTGDLPMESLPTMSLPTETLNQPNGKPATADNSPIEDTQEMVSPISSVLPDDSIDSNSEPTLPLDSTIDSDDYEFVTMPPNDIIFDTTEKNDNPDDTTTKLSPGDNDFIFYSV